MMAKRVWKLSAGMMLLAAARLVPAAVPYAEDLSGCALPNGSVVLPALGTRLAVNGATFKFSSKTHGSYAVTENGRPVTPDQVIARIQADRSCDLQYLPEKRSLWAFSGEITNLPGVFNLADVSGKQLDAPGVMPGTTRNLKGELQGAREGAVYLFKATDGGMVLLRVLDVTPDYLVGQWVYQPTGTTFDIPAHAPVPYAPPAELAATDAAAGTASTVPAQSPAAPPRGSTFSSTAPVNTGPIDRAFAGTNPDVSAPSATPNGPGIASLTTRPAALLPASTRPELGPGDVNEKGRIVLISGARPQSGLEPSMDTFAQQRTQMIQRRLEIITRPASGNADIERKAQAIFDLAALHADDPEVADALVSQIAFLNTRSPVREFSPDALHPCLAALKRMGKPATAAALRGLRQLDLDAPGEGIDSPMYRVGLLGMVIRAVEGDDVAEFILRREQQRESDPKHRAVFDYLLSK